MQLKETEFICTKILKCIVFSQIKYDKLIYRLL